MIFAGPPLMLHQFERDLSAKFDVGRFSTGTDIVFNRLFIKQHPNFDIHLSMEEFLSPIKPIDIPHARKKQKDDDTTATELRQFQCLTGKLNFLGHGILPQASLVASKLQQNVSRLKVSHIRQLNQALAHIRSLDPRLLFKSPSRAMSPASFPIQVLAFSDAASGTTSYGQTGFLCGLSFQENEDLICHFIDWHSSKQNRVSFSSAGAEILAAAHTADRSIHLAETLSSFLSGSAHTGRPELQLLIDSYGLHSTISTLHEQKDFRLRPTVARLRDCFESNEINRLEWILGPINPADALTKINPHGFKKLNHMMLKGIVPENLLHPVQYR